jgi:DNA-binding LacI/PurR family transcriptional regulator
LRNNCIDFDDVIGIIGSMSGPSPITSAVLDSHARPSERVRSYLNAEIARLGDGPDTRLPTTRRLALELDVSPRTVLSVYRQYADKGQVYAKVGDGTYLKSPKAAAEPAGRQLLRVGAVMSYYQPQWGYNTWHAVIHAGLLHRLSQCRPPASLLPLVWRDNEDAHALVEGMLGELDGMVIFPLANRFQIESMCRKAGMPYVHVNPPEESRLCDFVSSDYADVSRRLAAGLLRAGRRRFVFMTGGPMDASVSTRLRLAGFVGGLGAAMGNEASLRVLTADTTETKHARQAIQQALKDAPPPDAVYCAGDRLAIGAIEALETAGVRVPEQASVIGGSGYDISDTPWPKLTRASQPLHALGEAAVEMLQSRLERGGESVPGRILSTGLIGGATTRDSENRLLDIQPHLKRRPDHAD